MKTKRTWFTDGRPISLTRLRSRRSACRRASPVVDGTYGHSTPEFRAHPDFVGSGENIAMGQTGAEQVHVGWMRSDRHRENILRVGFDAIGVGVVCRNDGTMSATQIVGVAAPASMDRTPVETAVDPIVATGRGPRCGATGGPFG